MNNKPHPHAEILRAIADGVPLSEFELRHHGWSDVVRSVNMVAGYTSWMYKPDGWLISRKPRTHVVNGFTVPAPMDKEPEESARYYSAIPDAIEFFNDRLWDGGDYDKRVFSCGLCFATRDAAIANAKAMLKINPEAA